MKFKATFRAPRIDLGAYRKRLQEVLGEAIAKAAFDWLGATTNAVPVWSGASLATFSHLASGVGLNLSISPVARVNRIGLGLLHSTGTITTDAEKGHFLFEYSTDLQHLVFNEMNNGNVGAGPGQFGKLKNPGPYNFQEKGQKAFEQSVKDVQLPEPTYQITTYHV